MSELLNDRSGRSELRWKLLTTVSALALIGSVYGAQDAKADGETDHPVLWIELGGQLEQQTGQGDPYSPPFVINNTDSVVLKPGSPLSAAKPPLFSNGAEAKIMFEPSDTDWVFSASVRYGRSVGHRNFNHPHVATNQAHETVHGHTGFGFNTITTPSGYVSKRPIYGPVHKTIPQYVNEFAGAQVAQRQSHAIVDFTAGKDVGLGMFGSGSVSDINVGVRFAQFVSNVSGTIDLRPDADFLKFYNTNLQHRFPSNVWRYYGQAFHAYHAAFQSQRDFHGVGPALSWNASLPVVGEQPAGTLNVDWGANAALLFGRQRANGSHQSSTDVITHTAPRSKFPSIYPTHRTNAGNFNRSRTVTVPNVGGFAGLSFNFTNAKISAGYRGDFFFGAMDTGIDVRKTETVGFYGPFATISIGIGG
jgi:hypothetical protein